MRNDVTDIKEHSEETEPNNSNSSVTDNKRKSSFYEEIYDDDPEETKEIKRIWNARLDAIKRD